MRIIGWREWVALPGLGVEAIKAKLDTGARSSSLHTCGLETFRERGVLMVRFRLHPLQGKRVPELECVAEVADRRKVTDSGGHTEKRVFIVTPVVFGNDVWDMEVSLAKRDTMTFRLLIGRSAMNRRLVVDPSRSHLLGKHLSHVYGCVAEKDS